MGSKVDQLRHESNTSWDNAKKRRLVNGDNLKPSHEPGPKEFARPSKVLQDLLPRIEASKIWTASAAAQEPGIYTQRRKYSSTPGPTQNPLLNLSHSRYALPKRLVSNLRSMGISSIYPWQSSCLLGRGNLTGEQNLVYTAPTGSGKSLVADVLMMRRVIEGRKAILVLPYVSLVQEKLKWLRRALDGVERSQNLDEDNSLRQRPNTAHSAVRIAGLYGGARTRETWTDIDLAVCTIEKANSLVNGAIGDSSIDELGIVVMDELHMVDDDHRGYILELLAAKLLSLDQGVQLVGMSATLSDTKVLAAWLRAKFYESKYRPIPIEAALVCENQIFSIEAEATQAAASSIVSTEAHRRITPSNEPALKSPLHNAVVALAMETVKKGFGVLIFCGSRQACEATSQLIALALPSLASVDAETMADRQTVLENLQSLGSVPLDETLAKTVPYGVAFHHAGLTTEERDIVASAFDAGSLRVLVATCSLAAGINLPARRVILQGARMGREFVGPALLRQMRGRAGRKGKDELGESFICCKKEDLDEVKALLDTELAPITSSLTPQKRGITRALLEVIAIGLATHLDAIREYAERTLLYHTESPETTTATIDSALQQLVNDVLLRVVSDSCYEPTPLGAAIIASGFSPADGLFLHAELSRAMRAFVLDTDLHAFYTFVPINSSALEPDKISWPAFRREVESLDEAGLRVLSFVGVNPGFVNRQANSTKSFNLSDPADAEKARIYVRFYTALQLRDLCNEVPVWQVAARYGVARGAVQSLVQACQGFAAGVVKFCRHMHWDSLAALLDHMTERLAAGARADLLELAQIPFVKSRTARVLWENGYRNLAAVAEADVEALIQVLLLATPKKHKSLGEEEEGYLAKMRKKAEIIVSAAGKLWVRQTEISAEVEADL